MQTRSLVLKPALRYNSMDAGIGEVAKERSVVIVEGITRSPDAAEATMEFGRESLARYGGKDGSGTWVTFFCYGGNLGGRGSSRINYSR